jgi:hypothetical protein
MNTRRVLIALAGAAVITGATACGTSSTPPQTTSKPHSATTTSAPAATVTTTSPTQPTPTAGSPRACDDIGGTVDVNQICHAHNAGPGYEVSFTFPVDYPDQQALAEYMTRSRDNFIRFAAERPPHGRPYELDAKAKVYRSATTESLVFVVYSESGGAHPETGYKAFDYDLAKGVPITFDTLFKPGANPVEVLDPIVQRQMDKIWQGSGGPAPKNIVGAEVYQDFAITNYAVIFFISQGAWLPEAGGPQLVSVPRTELASILP